MLGKGTHEGHEDREDRSARAAGRHTGPRATARQHGPRSATSAPKGPGSGAEVDTSEWVTGPGRETSVLSWKASPDGSPAPSVQGERVNVSLTAQTK